MSATGVNWAGVSVAINDVPATVEHTDTGSFGLPAIVFEGPLVDWMGSDVQ